MKNLNRKHTFALASLAAVLGLAVVFNRPAAMAEEPAEGMRHQLGLIRDLLGLVNDLDKVSQSPSGSASLAVVGLEEYFKGEHAARAKYLEQVLPKVEDKAVQRLIRIQIADCYKKTNNREKALENLERVITNKPGAN